MTVPASAAGSPSASAAPAAPAPDAAPRRAGRLMWALVAGVGLFSLAAWIAVAVVMSLGFDLRVCTATAFVAALSLEAFVWSVAAALGVRAFQARRAIWRALTRRLPGARRGGD